MQRAYEKSGAQRKTAFENSARYMSSSGADGSQVFAWIRADFTRNTPKNMSV